MSKTQITTQADLSGGFNPTTDPFKTKPNEWIVAANAIISRPGGDDSASTVTVGSAISRPPLRTPPAFNPKPHFAYAPNLPTRFFIARCDNTEEWVMGGTSLLTPEFVAPISQGNTALGMDSSTTTLYQAVLPFSTAIDVSAIYNTSPWGMTLDATYANYVGDSQLNIYFMNDSGDYALYTKNFTAPTQNIPLSISFASETGSFDPTAVTSVKITFASSGGDSLNLVISDLRFENAVTTTANIIESASAFGQGTSPATLSPVITNLSGSSVMVSCQDMILLGIYPLSYWIKLRTGLTKKSITTDPIEGTKVYFAEFPNPDNPQTNIMAIADGADNCFTYNPNATPGYQFNALIQIPNNVQTIVPSAFPAGGQYKLVLAGNTTGFIQFDASATDIQDAIAALPTVGVGNVKVTGFLGSQSAGLPTGYEVTFGGNLSGLDPGVITSTASTLADITTGAITLTITSVPGSFQNATPASGSWCYEFNGDITTPIAWNATALDIQNALNALASITTAGGVIVTTDLSPQVVITFNLGATESLINVVNNLLLDSFGNKIFIDNVITTDGSTTLVNAKVSITVPDKGFGQATSGTFVSFSWNGHGPIGNPDDLINYNATGAQIQTWLRSQSFFGTNIQVDSGDWTPSPVVVEFIGTLAGTDLPASLWGFSSSDFQDSASQPLIPFTFANVQTGSTTVVKGVQTTTFKSSPNEFSVWRYVETYKNIMFLAGNDTLPMTLRPSAIDDYTSYAVSGVNDITLNSNPGDRITGIYDMGQSLVITSNSQIWNLYGSNPDSTTGDFSLVPSESLVGCIEMAAGIRVGPGLYFYSGDDFYVYVGGQSVSLTKGKMKAILSQIPVSQRRMVSVTYNLQRNILIWNFPQNPGQDGAYWQSVTYSLDTGAFGMIGDGGLQFTGANPPTLDNVKFGGVANQYCGVNLTSDGTNVRPVYFQFGFVPYEYDPPAGTAMNAADAMTLISAFNFCKSPMITKDFMRLILSVNRLGGNNAPFPGTISLIFFSDRDLSTIRQVITGLTPVNGQIDVLLNGVVGDSIAVGVRALLVSNTDGGQVEISGYITYWQAVEDL